MRIEENKELAPLTTLGVGGAARWFVEAETEAEKDAVVWAGEREVPLFVLGGWKQSAGRRYRIRRAGVARRPRGNSRSANGRIRGERSSKWRPERTGMDLFNGSVEDSCAGMECLAGIPGTVGGTPVQNVGAYGQEVADTIGRVRAYDLHANSIIELSSAECGFGYRQKPV